MQRLLFLFCLMLLTVSTPALAAETAQRWAVVPEKSGLIHQINGKTPQARMQDYSAEIYFDPALLDKSSFLISFTFAPPGVTNPPEDRLIYGYFQSSSVTRKDKNTFMANGTLNILGNKQPQAVAVSASFVKGSTTPQMFFDGGFTFQPRNFLSQADASAYPSDVAVQFRFLAEPLP